MATLCLLLIASGSGAAESRAIATSSRAATTEVLEWEAFGWGLA